MPLIRFLLLFIALALAAPAGARTGLKLTGAQQDLLSTDEAFQLLPAQRRGGMLHVEWNIAPGYFLYRDRLHIELTGPAGLHAGAPVLPAGEAHDDEHGPVMVFRGILAADLPLTGRSAEPIRLRVRYQGCADAGVCYPPQVREVGVEAAP